MMLASERPPRLLLSANYRHSLRVIVRQSRPRTQLCHAHRLCSISWVYSITKKATSQAKLKLSEDHSGSNPQLMSALVRVIVRQIMQELEAEKTPIDPEETPECQS